MIKIHKYNNIMQIGIHGKTWYNVFNIIKEVIDVEETQ